jgi:hypothetical protein
VLHRNLRRWLLGLPVVAPPRLNVQRSGRQWAIVRHVAVSPFVALAATSEGSVEAAGHHGGKALRMPEGERQVGWPRRVVSMVDVSGQGRE